MTKEYIEREAAIETFEQAFDNSWEVSGTLDRIRAIPAADVAEVVRCKDCHFSYHTPRGETYCNRLRCRWGSGERYYWVNDKDYCSWGVREADNG